MKIFRFNCFLIVILFRFITITGNALDLSDRVLSHVQKRQASSTRPNKLKDTKPCERPPDAIGTLNTFYDVSGNTIQVKPGSKVPPLTTLYADCSKGYILDDGKTTFQAICSKDDGLWIPSLKTCYKSCPILKPENVNLVCKYNDEQVSCNRSLISGTKVSQSCIELHHPEYRVNYFYIECQENGEWDRPLVKCIPDCGRRRQQPLIAGGRSAELGDFPWHVAIYELSKNKPLLICGGTLISSNMVLSAAHCFFIERLGISTADKPEKYEIVVGKVSRNYTKLDNKYQKTHKIKQILTPKKAYNPGLYNNYGSDIVIVVLQEPVSISPYVLPVCIEWIDDHSFNPQANATGIVAGWGLDETGNESEFLQYTKLPYVDDKVCNSMGVKSLTQDKFCSGSVAGSKPRKGDSGGGLVFQLSDTNLYYIRGIVSTDPGNPSAQINFVTFTDISYYKEWIQDALRGNKTITNVSRPSGPSFSKNKTSVIASQKICPPLKSENVDLICLQNNEAVDCGSQLVSGTRVYPRCKPLHHKEYPVNYDHIQCEESGKWDMPIVKCVPNCGIIRDSPLIAHGSNSYENESLSLFPWNVAIYLVTTKTLFCGGTLISSTTILTAAHCFTNYFDPQYPSFIDKPEFFEIVVSKVTRKYTKIDNAYQKKYKVWKIIPYIKGYNPIVSRYSSDIAVIIPSEPVVISPYVLPACYEWTNNERFDPGDGVLGVISGWGYNEQFFLGEHLQYTKLPFVHYKKCIRKIKGVFRDKFCAGRNDSWLGSGDNGAGLIFRHSDNLYYVRGIASKSDQRYSERLQTFTDLSYFKEWIQDIIENKTTSVEESSLSSPTKTGSSFRLIQNCGIVRDHPEPSNASQVSLHNFPWHVAVYKIQNPTTFLCGATLISSTLILTAAHCFYDASIGKTAANRNPKIYEIIVAKVNRNYSTIDNAYQKKYQIKHILDNEDFPYDPVLTGEYSSDITVLVLEKPVAMSQYVFPACFDVSSHRRGFRPSGDEVTGKMAGWGLNENQEPTEILHHVTMPFVNYTDCITEISTIPGDTFCAGKIGGNVSRLSLGDGGGGLVFQHSDNMYYLRGIVGVQSVADQTSIIIFTDVSYFKEWIQDIFQEKESTLVSSTSSTTTSTNKPTTCASGSFKCTDGKCIQKAYRCNGKRDCSDGSDEIKCGTSTSTKKAT